MVFKKMVVKLCALTMAAVMMASTGAYCLQAYANSRLDEMQSQYAQLERQKNEIEKELKETRGKKEDEVAYQKQLLEQIEVIRGQLDLLNGQIADLSDKISASEKDIANKEAEIDRTYDLFGERMRTMYMAGDTSMLEVLLSSSSVSDFLARTETIKRVAEHDQQLIDQLKQQKDELQTAKEKLAEELSKREETKKQAESKKAELDQKVAESDEEIILLDKLAKQYGEQSEGYSSQMEQMQQSIDDMFAQIEKERREREQKEKEEQEKQNQNQNQGGGTNTQPPAPVSPPEGGSGEVSTKGYLWPVAGYKHISCYYGWRTLFGRPDFHSGIDISGANIYGQPILASRSGTVVRINRDPNNSTGYGLHVVLDHGDGYTTLYAHGSQILVNVGDSVEQGQPIMKVGSTGMSSGPHLHIEVRYLGQHTDPLPFLK